MTHSRLLAALLAAWSTSVALASQERTQSFTLQPGWNAIYLEVEPSDPDPEVIFQGIPIRSVWTWRARLTSLEFIADPSEEELKGTGWLGYFPPSRPDAFLSNLKRIQVNRAYLVKLGGASPVALEVTGRPSWNRQGWQPNAFNLVGAGVTATPPTFQSYFEASPAHAGQPIYRLDPGGSWRLASPAESMREGESFWVFCAGASDYEGPFDVEFGVGRDLDFGPFRDRATLEVVNRRSAPRDFTVSIASQSQTGVLHLEDPSITNLAWSEFSGPQSLTAVAPEARRALRFGVRRESLAGISYLGLLEISDGAARRWLPVKVDGVRVTSFADGATRGLAGSEHAGLWIGTVTLDQVGEVHSATPTVLTETPAALEARLILHVADSGEVRLLREVLQMWVDGTTVDVPGTPNQTTATPGRYVQITDKALLANPEIEGGVLRAGKRVGRRLSTAFYDFDDVADEVATSGTWGGGLAFDLALARTSPTNPFRHKYHPEHDDAAGDPPESFAITRHIALVFAAADPEDADAPDWGTKRVAGTYSETIEGLHSDLIRVGGTFTLNRYSNDGVLNPAVP